MSESKAQLEAEVHDMDKDTAPPAAPSQLTGYAKQAQGQLYQAVGAVSSDPSWKSDGQRIADEGNLELHQGQDQAKSDADYQQLTGKAQSAFGFLTGNQETAIEGNKKVESAEWKASAAEGRLPNVSMDRMKGKVESAIGAATGDINRQQAGNIRAEKAQWKEGH